MSIVSGKTINKYRTHHKISDNHDEQEEGYTESAGYIHAVPHGLYPFSTQNSEHYHERMQKIVEVPTRSFGENISEVIL